MTLKPLPHKKFAACTPVFSSSGTNIKSGRSALDSGTSLMCSPICTFCAAMYLSRPKPREVVSMRSRGRTVSHAESPLRSHFRRCLATSAFPLVVSRACRADLRIAQTNTAARHEDEKRKPMHKATVDTQSWIHAQEKASATTASGEAQPGPAMTACRTTNYQALATNWSMSSESFANVCQHSGKEFVTEFTGLSCGPV